MKNLGVQLSNQELLMIKGGSGGCYECYCYDGDPPFYVDSELVNDLPTIISTTCNTLGGGGSSGSGWIGSCSLTDSPNCNLGGPS